MSNTKHSYQDSDSDPSGNPNAKDSIFAEDGTPPNPTSEESPEQLVDALEHQLADLRSRELKAQAELENFRRRTLRDVETQLKFASSSLVSDLLEVVDNLHRATESAAASSTQNVDGLIAGVRMVQQQFANVLAKHHCKPIPGVGHPFDPNVHQAIAQQPSNDFPAGTVLIETSRGYLMHDRVVRPSMVIVSTGPAQTE
jgi:molecular chaperone GrpE